MMTHTMFLRGVLTGALVSAVGLLPALAFAHCDTMDGPVVLAAKAALERRDVTPVLQWIKPDDEAEIKAAFSRTLAVRGKGAEARQLADQFFFETLVRVHRAGEGAPFTGLKPAGVPLEPVIAEADKALETGVADQIVKLVTDEAAAGIHKRFAEAKEKKRHAGHNVESGREFVAAYVEYVHYVEGLHRAAAARERRQAAGGEAHSHPPEHTEPAPGHSH
ncbi:MAG TPA: DUF6448 family protein [Candidatus Paceibacterota bacterium]|nr:DUF6448 family protein [Candidatus Paceibacterota bacterium]